MYAVDFHEQFQSCICRKLEINFMGKLLGEEKSTEKIVNKRRCSAKSTTVGSELRLP